MEWSEWHYVFLGITFAPTRGRARHLTEVRRFSPVAVGRGVRQQLIAHGIRRALLRKKRSLDRSYESIQSGFAHRSRPLFRYRRFDLFLRVGRETFHKWTVFRKNHNRRHTETESR